MAITVVHTFVLIAETPAEYTTLLSQIATYVATGRNPGETVASQNNQASQRKITLVINNTGTLS